MTTNTSVAYLGVVQKQLIRGLVVPLVLGLVGNAASCIVFRQKQFRSSAVSLLFTAASIFNILVLGYGIGTSLYAIDHVSSDTYSIIFCEVRLYIRHVLLMSVRSYIVLACVACFALSSSRTNLRSLCQLQYVKWTVVAVPFIWPLIAIHMPFLTIIRNNQCVNIDSYVLPFGIYVFLIVGVLPIIIMTFFILLTMKNLRRLQRRIQPSIIGPTRLKKRDQQFIRMLAALVVMYLITNLFYPINVLYEAITYWSSKSTERVAIESIVFFVTSNYILYINNVSPFFLFVSSSTTFRKTFCHIICKYTRYMAKKRTRIQQAPLTVIPTGQNRL